MLIICLDGQYHKRCSKRYDKNECVIHIENLRQALNHGLNLKKVYRAIKFNQIA